MNFTFPEATFVKKNFLCDQLDHVLGEAHEAIDAHMLGTDLAACAIELLDVIHSAETALRILINLDPKIDLSDLVYYVIAKNRARGYYP